MYSAIHSANVADHPGKQRGKGDKNEPLVGKMQQTRHLSVKFEDFVVPEHIIPSSTLKDMLRNAEALLNEPDAIMPAASSDPRVRSVKSRHGKAPLIVLLLKTGHQF